MENQNNHAEIFIGRRKRNFYEGNLSYASVFSLHYGGKIVDLTEHTSGCYSESCSEVAEEYAERLSKLGVLRYILTNGQAFEFGNLEKIGCEFMPEDGLKKFEEIVDRNLGSIVA